MLAAKWLMPRGVPGISQYRGGETVKKNAIRGEMAFFYALGSGPGKRIIPFTFLPSQTRIIHVIGVHGKASRNAIFGL
jgi:hypothetical protein